MEAGVQLHQQDIKQEATEKPDYGIGILVILAEEVVVFKAGWKASSRNKEG
jgi:hypothetical protein